MTLDAVFAAIDDARGDLVALTADLIRMPTVNPPGRDYRPCCDFLARRLQADGFETAVLRAAGAPGDSDAFPRYNVVARRDSGRPGPCVHFNSHIDVVDPGAGWTVDPFAAEVRDGRVYGRGACDMKGGLAASIIAVEALLRAVPDLPGAIEVSGTADEETGGYGGVAWLAEQGHFAAPLVDHVIIPEPLNKDCVCLGHRGVWWGEVTVRGHIAHGSMPFLGVSAIRGAAAFLAKVEDDLLPRLNQRRTAMPVIPEGARQSTLNINAIHGGADPIADPTAFPAALVADSCTVTLDRRFLVEEDVAQVRGEIEDLLRAVAAERPDFDYDLRELWSVDPTMTDPASPLVVALTDAVGTVLGNPARHVASPGTYDQKHIARIANLHNCVAYGPGALELAHQPDEFVAIDDMVASAKVMAAATHRLLTGIS